MKLIVGLGNPGPQYAHTRHNAGFQIVDRFATRHKFTLRKMQFNAVVTQGSYGDQKVLLARPMTFMNDSGRAVGPLLRWLKLELADQSEAIHLVDEPGVVTCADQSSALLELAQRAHPDAVVLLPESLVG